MRHTKLASPVPRDNELPFTPYSYPILTTQYLARPLAPLSANMGDVLNRRESQRSFAALPTERLSALLWHAVRTRTSRNEETGFLWQHRATPSAGGRHPIDVLIVETTSSQYRLCLYDPISHALRTLDVNPSHVDRLVTAIDGIVSIQKATLLWFIAQVDRTLSKYDHGESLIWRDAGALLATLSLVATALDLSCCAIGATNDQVLETAFQAGDRLIDVGSCLIGTR